MDMFCSQNKLIIISGCSGGGKSTLINELSSMGYAVIPEAATKIVKENGQVAPWINSDAFCNLLIEQTIKDFQKATVMEVLENIIFFDRSFLEGIRYYKLINSTDSNQYDSILNEFRYFSTVFIAPPWEEIYCQNEARKHSFQKSIADFEQVVSFYSKYGYQTIELPRADVSARAQFILSSINAQT